MPNTQRDTKSIRKEIELAEQNIVKATNAKDQDALMVLLSPDILINSPANKVIDRTKMIETTLKGEMTYSEYENSIEGFSLFAENTAVIMGKETFVHADQVFGSDKVVRRYTDVWQWHGHHWVQIARQATYTKEHDGGT